VTPRAYVGKNLRRAYVPKAQQIEREAARMRAYYLTHGRGCKSRAKAIEKRAELTAAKGER
jgi:hypothetical protein